MFNAIRARIGAAWVALFTFTVVALAVFAPAQMAEARGGGFSGGGRVSMSYSRSYSAPRVYAAPRTIAMAPRVIVTRPVVVVRPRVYGYRPWYNPWYRPAIIVPMVQPQQVVEPDGSATQPVVAEQSSGIDVFFKTLLIILLVAAVIATVWIFVSWGYGHWYVDEPFDIFTDVLIMDEIAMDGGFL